MNTGCSGDGKTHIQHITQNPLSSSEQIRDYKVIWMKKIFIAFVFFKTSQINIRYGCHVDKRFTSSEDTDLTGKLNNVTL